MGWIDRWDIVLAFVATYVAVMTLVRLMARRRDQDIAEVERQMQSLRNQPRRNRGGAKNRDAA